MPVYTYRCDNCGHQFDKHQSYSDNALIVCPNCKKHTLHKVYRATGVSFKGSGYYVTDKRTASSSSSGKPSKKKETTSGESSGSEKASEAPKSETKSESKTEKPKPAKSDD
jgi:putative FmdB family regulatory protein